MSDFDSFPRDMIEYYDGEIANVITGLIEFIKVRRQDPPYFNHDKELIIKFMIFILDRINVIHNDARESLIYLIQQRLRFPGEY